MRSRGKYIAINTAVLGAIVFGAVALYLGVGAFASTRGLIITIALTVIGLFVIGTLADAAFSAPPQGWVKCDDEWICEHGRVACATSPKISNKGIVHYHPAA